MTAKRKKTKRLLKSRPSPPVKKRKKVAPPKPDKRKGLRGAKKRAETLRRKRISKALKAYNRKKKTIKVFLEGDSKADRKWGEKLAAEAKRAQREARKAPPRVKSRIHISAMPPEAFVADTGDKLNEIKTALESALAAIVGPAAQEALGTKLPLNADVRVHPNADGSIDGELIIKGIPRGVTMRDVSIFVEGLIGKVSGSFISVGFRSSHSEEFTKESYNRVRGKVQVQTHFHRTSKKAIAFVHAREIDSTLIDRKYHKPEDFFVRIHWNPQSAKPKRKH